MSWGFKTLSQNNGAVFTSPEKPTVLSVDTLAVSPSSPTASRSYPEWGGRTFTWAAACPSWNGWADVSVTYGSGFPQVTVTLRSAPAGQTSPCLIYLFLQ